MSTDEPPRPTTRSWAVAGCLIAGVFFASIALIVLVVIFVAMG